MARKTFQMKRHGLLKTYSGFLKDMSKAQQFAEIGTINGMAFKTRQSVLEELDESMTIRAPGFVKGSVRVAKASLRKPMSEVGSIKRERFTGWIEQETGKKATRKRIQTRAARMGNWKRKVAPRFRLKPATKFVRPADVGLNDNQIPQFLQILNRRRFKQPYFIPVRYKRLQRGIYIFKGRFPNNKIRRIQDFEPENVQPKREPWMSRAVGHLTQDVINAEYRKAMRISIRKSAALKRYRR